MRSFRRFYSKNHKIEENSKNNNGQIESKNKVNNRKIAKELVNLVEKYPNWRFEQLLQNIGITIKGKDGYIIDLFNEKSETTYLRMMDYIEKLNQS